MRPLTPLVALGTLGALLAVGGPALAGAPTDQLKHATDRIVLKEGEGWRVYDVVIEGVSLVSSYRTQFTRIIQQAGYSELVKKLRTKQDELAPENSQRVKKQS